MRLVQFQDPHGQAQVGVVGEDGQNVLPVKGVGSTYELAGLAIGRGQGLAQTIKELGLEGPLPYEPLLAEKRLLPPLTHPDPARCMASGTGLTHLGSAKGRDAMHAAKLADSDPEKLTDSMRMFNLGLAGGRPEEGRVGVQPEWFYKGDGSTVAAPGQALAMPWFADDGGEEPELVGAYVVGPDGTPYRLGYALGNEFSDHVMERVNYLYLAHSKLRMCSMGPELLLGPAPARVEGMSRILRDGQVIWQKPFVTGEEGMSHSLANLEHHHFKYAAFRRPGDVHLHFFGTATLSHGDGVRALPGDVFQIEAPGFGRPLENPLAVEQGGGLTRVKAL